MIIESGHDRAPGPVRKGHEGPALLRLHGTVLTGAAMADSCHDLHRRT
jgi:hypothetical protein